MAKMPKHVIGLIWHCLHGNTLLQWVSVAVRRNVQKLGSAKTCAPYAFPFTWGVSSNCSKQMHFWFTATRRSANAATANPPAMFIFPDKLFSYQHKLAKPPAENPLAPPPEPARNFQCFVQNWWKMHNLQPHGGWRTSHNAGELTTQPGANSQHLYCMKIKQRYRIWCMDRNKLRLFWYSQTILPQSKQTYTWFHCHCLRFMFQACLITHTTSIARIDHDSLVMLVVHQSNVWCAVHTTKTIGGGNKTTCGSTGHGSKK